jgi:hypothetical protein
METSTQNSNPGDLATTIWPQRRPRHVEDVLCPGLCREISDCWRWVGCQGEGPKPDILIFLIFWSCYMFSNVQYLSGFEKGVP